MSCLLWDRFMSAYPAQARHWEAGFSSPRSTAMLVLLVGLLGIPALLQGCNSHHTR